MTAKPLIDEIADLPIESRYPEGIWRVPLEMILQCSSSSYASAIRRRQASGASPFSDGAVFLRDRRFYAIVDWPRREANSCLQLVFALDLWPWENRDALRTQFGLRKEKP